MKELKIVKPAIFYTLFPINIRYEFDIALTSRFVETFHVYQGMIPCLPRHEMSLITPMWPPPRLQVVL